MMGMWMMIRQTQQQHKVGVTEIGLRLETGQSCSDSPQQLVRLGGRDAIKELTFDIVDKMIKLYSIECSSHAASCSHLYIHYYDAHNPIPILLFQLTPPYPTSRSHLALIPLTQLVPINFSPTPPPLYCHFIQNNNYADVSQL